uniref:Mechanosensitive ion channel MscS domain-containing protein n=1 Tax=Chromera velia CCMP2878 TaxID=1169474 RepID=A0A0G4IC29_9ALVE|eukprot:Cvel_12993.t1-p1 / transcript=Cvel_12993.t1 / gene=Cvel_12993 / organism=Chromera_velia_CCMP2878 / gene_product=Mechanosensitive ion channel protein 10, putative / transcript_product=Mechanosensitive ion channel protein 10, putative / location=Cvel_scaffold871:19911-25664(+) / protein_length=1049 / sequence_SO=supercontig / SO=protein_coding / is_pseudo=false
MVRPQGRQQSPGEYSDEGGRLESGSDRCESYLRHHMNGQADDGSGRRQRQAHPGRGVMGVRGRRQTASVCSRCGTQVQKLCRLSAGGVLLFCAFVTFALFHCLAEAQKHNEDYLDLLVAALAAVVGAMACRLIVFIIRLIFTWVAKKCDPLYQSPVRIVLHTVDPALWDLLFALSVLLMWDRFFSTNSGIYRKLLLLLIEGSGAASGKPLSPSPGSSSGRSDTRWEVVRKCIVVFVLWKVKALLLDLGYTSLSVAAFRSRAGEIVSVLFRFESFRRLDAYNSRAGEGGPDSRNSAADGEQSETLFAFLNGKEPFAFDSLNLDHPVYESDGQREAQSSTEADDTAEPLTKIATEMPPGPQRKQIRQRTARLRAGGIGDASAAGPRPWVNFEAGGRDEPRERDRLPFAQTRMTTLFDFDLDSFSGNNRGKAREREGWGWGVRHAHRERERERGVHPLSQSLLREEHEYREGEGAGRPSSSVPPISPPTSQERDRERERDRIVRERDSTNPQANEEEGVEGEGDQTQKMGGRSNSSVSLSAESLNPIAIRRGTYFVDLPSLALPLNWWEAYIGMQLLKHVPFTLVVGGQLVEVSSMKEVGPLASSLFSELIQREEDERVAAGHAGPALPRMATDTELLRHHHAHQPQANHPTAQRQQQHLEAEERITAAGGGGGGGQIVEEEHGGAYGSFSKQRYNLGLDQQQAAAPAFSQAAAERSLHSAPPKGGGEGEHEGVRQSQRDILSLRPLRPRSVLSPSALNRYMGKKEAALFSTQMDRKGEGFADRREFLDCARRAFSDRRGLADSLSSHDQIADVLGTVLNVGLWIVLLAAILVVFHFDIRAFLVSAAAVLASAGFIFSNSLKNFVDSLTFVFFQHPYDVGNRVHLKEVNDGGTLRVVNITAMTTVFCTATNETIVVPNFTLATCSVVNEHRSGCASFVVAVRLRLDEVSTKQLSALKTNLLEYIGKNPKEWVAAETFFWIESFDQEGLVRWCVQVTHHLGFYRWDAVNASRDRLLNFLSAEMKRLGVNTARRVQVDAHLSKPTVEGAEGKGK